MDTGLRAAVKAAGSKYRLAKVLQIKPQAIQKWSRIPSARVIAIEAEFGVPRETLRPDLYPPRKK